MVATCGVGTMLYVLPMLLGRTYDMQHDKVGIDIYNQSDIDHAEENPYHNPEVTSNYQTIEDSSDKREFLGISGALGLKISSGLVDIKGSGNYLKDTSNIAQSVEILIKMTFTTMTKEISIDAKPKTEWTLLDKKEVGTHVVTSLRYGGEVYASVNFIALKAEYLQDIKGEVLASISKKGAFDAEAQGKLEMLSRNISSRAKMEIDYYATVPLTGVPTTIAGLKMLLDSFKDQVAKVNNGSGVAICAGFRPLSDFDNKFTFIKNRELTNSLESFNYLFDNLREAKSYLNTLINSLPETVSEDYMKKVADFSDRLTKTLRVFYDVIGNMDLEKGSEQLTKAETEFDTNSKILGDNRYTKEVRRLIKENNEKEKDDPNKPRGLYIRWGKKTCNQRTAKELYVGFMASFTENGIGSGTNYQCLPENPDMKVDADATGLNARNTKLGGVRFLNFNMFQNNGKKVEGKGAPCVVCQTLLRPTTKMFPSMTSCPGDWVQEYTGFMVSSYEGKLRAEFVCVDFDPDTNDHNSTTLAEPRILPIKMGDGAGQSYTKDASLPCSVCSK